MNAVKHGERSAEVIALRRDLCVMRRLIRDERKDLRAMMRGCREPIWLTG